MRNINHILPYNKATIITTLCNITTIPTIIRIIHNTKIKPNIITPIIIIIRIMKIPRTVRTTIPNKLAKCPANPSSFVEADTANELLVGRWRFVLGLV
jgi:hypothetical protein